MSRKWTRLWHDMPTDPKWRVVAKRSSRPLTEVMAVFMLMMTLADEAGSIEGWSSEDAAAALDTETEHVESIRTAMQGKVLDGDLLTGWEKRQPERDDDSHKRVRAFRERKRAEKQAVTGGVTQCNAVVTQRNAPDKDSDSEVDKDSDSKKTNYQQASSEVVSAHAEVVEMPAGLPSPEDALGEMIASVASWGCGMPEANARQWLATTVRTFGQGPTARAYHKLKTDLATGSLISRPLQTWTAIAMRMQAEGAVPRKKSVREVTRELIAAGAGRP